MEPDIKEDKIDLHGGGEHADIAGAGQVEAEYSITASDILEFLFCPRFTYFQNYLDIPQHEEKRFKVQKGRKIHEDITRVNPDYLRKKIGCRES